MQSRTKVMLGGALLLAGGAWLWARGDAPARRPTASATTLAERVLRDLAAYRGALGWDTSHGTAPATPPYAAGVTMRASQTAPLAVETDLGSGVLELRGRSWSVQVNTQTVTEIVCHRAAPHGHPREIWMTLAGPPDAADPDAAAPTLLAVHFDDDQHFSALCDRHRLRKDGDF